MSSSSAARGAGDAAPTLTEQAESRRQRVQLTGWSLGAVAVMLVLLRQLALTCHELRVLLGTVALPVLTRGAHERVYSVRFSNSAAISSEKVRPFVGQQYRMYSTGPYEANNSRRWQTNGIVMGAK